MCVCAKNDIHDMYNICFGLAMSIWLVVNRLQLSSQCDDYIGGVI